MFITTILLMRWRGLKMENELNGFIDETPNIESLTKTGADLYALDTREIPKLISPIIPMCGMWAIAGSSDTGKSMLYRQLAIAVATGNNFLGFPITAKYNKVIFIATEDDDFSTAFLLRKQAENAKGLENIRFYFETDQIPEYLDVQLNDEPADLIIIDAWSDVFGQNLNDSALIRKVLNQYSVISKKHNCSIGFLHHTGKRTQKLAPSKDNLLSGQGFEAKLRLVFELRNDVNNSNIKHLCIVKGNYLGKEFKDSSYKLEFNPESFQFTNTGERVPIEDLAELTDNEKVKKHPLLKANQVDEETHLKILEQIFKNGFKPKIAELKTRLSEKYSHYFSTPFGGRRVDAFFDYLKNDLGFIGKVGKDHSPISYYCLTTHNTTENVASDAVSS